MQLEASGDLLTLGLPLSNLGFTYLRIGQHSNAKEYLERRRALAERLSDREGEAMALGNLGDFHHKEGRDGQAIGFYERALEILQSTGYRREEGRAFVCSTRHTQRP